VRHLCQRCRTAMGQPRLRAASRRASPDDGSNCHSPRDRGRELTAILGCPGATFWASLRRSSSTSWPSTTPSIWRASGLDGALSRMQTPPDCRDEQGRSEPQVGSDDVLAAWVLSDVSRGRSRSTSYLPLTNSRRSAFILPGSTIAIPWEPPGYTFKIA